MSTVSVLLLFLFTDPPTTEIYTLSLHDALPISNVSSRASAARVRSIVAGVRAQPVLTEWSVCWVGGDAPHPCAGLFVARSEEHTSELQSQFHLVCRLLLEKKKLDSHIVVRLRRT